MHSADCCRKICVYLSVTFRYSVETAKYIIKLFFIVTYDYQSAIVTIESAIKVVGQSVLCSPKNSNETG